MQTRHILHVKIHLHFQKLKENNATKIKQNIVAFCSLLWNVINHNDEIV